MTTTPLTDQQLADIQARADAATPGPWSTAKDVGYAKQYGETFVANWTGEYMRGVGDISLGVGHEAEADLAFVLAARTDVPLLLAELGRVRAELATAREQSALCSDCGHVGAAHSEDGERDCTASGARVTSCSCSYFIPAASPSA